MNIKGAIFDLDGTIIDSMPMWYSLYGNYLAEAQIEPTEELLDFLRHASIPVAAKRFSETIIPRTAEEIEAELYGHVADYYKNCATVRANVDKLIKKLHSEGIKMCVATATESGHAKNALSHIGLLEYFCDVLSCKDLGIEKNRPDIYFEALNRLGVGQAEAVVFEDALHAVETAKSGGFYVVAIYEQTVEDHHRVEELADRYITDYNELL
ncbi:MAG: HAD family phosphatase [Clostridia bacterium]|nr:HAD family phosphatase [Clostridia bacterium]